MSLRFYVAQNLRNRDRPSRRSGAGLPPRLLDKLAEQHGVHGRASLALPAHVAAGLVAQHPSAAVNTRTPYERDSVWFRDSEKRSFALLLRVTVCRD